MRLVAGFCGVARACEERGAALCRAAGKCAGMRERDVRVVLLLQRSRVRFMIDREPVCGVCVFAAKQKAKKRAR